MKIKNGDLTIRYSLRRATVMILFDKIKQKQKQTFLIILEQRTGDGQHIEGNNGLILMSLLQKKTIKVLK